MPINRSPSKYPGSPLPETLNPRSAPAGHVRPGRTRPLRRPREPPPATWHRAAAAAEARCGPGPAPAAHSLRRRAPAPFSSLRRHHAASPAAAPPRRPRRPDLAPAAASIAAPHLLTISGGRRPPPAAGSGPDPPLPRLPAASSLAGAARSSPDLPRIACRRNPRSGRLNFLLSPGIFRFKCSCSWPRNFASVALIHPYSISKCSSQST